MKRFSPILLLTLVTILATYSTSTYASRVPQKRLKCLVGQCWKKIDMKKLEKSGCPTPILIVNNVLREMNGYLAAADLLKLSDKQIKELTALRYRTHRRIMKGKALMNLLSISLLDNMATDDFDLQDVKDQVSQLKQSCSGLLYGIILDTIEARKVLTPEQRKKARDIAL